MLVLSSLEVLAQCNPPASLWLLPPQTSTSLTLKWSPVLGASQFQLRYWESSAPDDKTIVDDCGPVPFTLRGLRKNTAYTLQVRSKCGNLISDWGVAINAATINSSGSCNNLPAGVLLSAGTANIGVNWASTGSHTIRYRLGNSGDWLVPTGALNLMSSPFSIVGLSPGMYQVEIKRNCSATASTYLSYSTTIGDACGTPDAPVVTPFVTSAELVLPSTPGTTGYNVEYRLGTSGDWINGGAGVPPSILPLSPPLMHSTVYQVQIQAICNAGVSGFSPPTTFTTKPETGQCLANKNAGKNLSAAGILEINHKCNNPSPFTYSSMIGVNDGGLVFRSFQNETNNQITQLTTQFRNFHTMDEDFNTSMQGYDLNIKPKDTQPEGSPARTSYNKGLYTLYRQTHGFGNITGATELLQYAPQSWKEKIYKESDWSAAGPSGIMASFENYTKKFIDEFAPANGVGTQILVSNFQVGNELWDYPVKTDYHSLLLGARNAFVSKYGPKSAGKWKMKLVAGAFQAYRDNTCNSMLRDFSNCDGGLERHDFIGDYLEVADCMLLKDLDAIDCHPYSFKPATTQWTYPEDPSSETWQIRNLAVWLNANQDTNTGVLQNTRLWSTEFGFDSNPTTGVGEKTHSAYLLRGLLLHSRYHFEKVFFYNAFDFARPSDQYYNGLYNSAGFWKLGTHPANSAWASPIAAHGATAKPAWYGMLDFKARFGEHVFFKALVEDAEAYIILIAKPDSTDPYLLFWSPRQTNDNNINEDIPVNLALNFQGVLPGSLKVESTIGQSFAESALPGQTFSAASISSCGMLTLTRLRRTPAFIRLVPCLSCINITNPGSIVGPTISSGSAPFDPAIITNGADAGGGNGGIIEYQWQQSQDNVNFLDIPGATALTYDPPGIAQTTYFRRAAKRSTCSDFIFTTSIGLMVVQSICPKIRSFERIPHSNPVCNPDGDYFYRIVLNQVAMNEQIILTELPTNGIHIPMSMLNGVPLTPAIFFANLNYVGEGSLKWLVNANNGSTQTLQLYYCWTVQYPEPVDVTMATTLCSNQSTSCVEGFNVDDPEIGSRGDRNAGQSGETFRFTVAPNPGTDQLLLTYIGKPTDHATLRIVTTTGKCLSTQQVTGLENQLQWNLNTQDLPPGIYFVCLQTSEGVRWATWERI